MPNAVTWAYALLGWTHHVSESGITQRPLLQALVSFDLFACYLDTYAIESEHRHIIKREVFPSRPAIVIFKTAKNL